MGEVFEPGNWSVDMEVNLFHAMRGHKPVGVNRHFHMMIIHDKVSQSNRKLTATDVWKHLSTLYNLQALNESEILPFPNKQMDFKLPSDSYKQLSEKEFPRMQSVGSASPMDDSKAKPEGQAKGGKASRSDIKTPQSSKPADKSGASSESKSSSSKSEKTGSSSQAKADAVKGQAKSGSQASSSSTPEPSPKRGKRTRNNQSASNSPASDAPASKRRR